MLVAADWDVKQQIIKLFVRIQHTRDNTSLISHFCLMKCPELDQSTSAHSWAVFVMFIHRLRILVETFIFENFKSLDLKVTSQGGDGLE